MGILFVVGLLLVLSWIWICNDRTCSQQIAYMPEVGDPLFSEKMEALVAVDYNTHMIALITLRDPKKLYNPIVFGE